LKNNIEYIRGVGLMKKILVAVDGSNHSKKAVERSAELSKNYGSEVVLVCVQQFPGLLVSEPETDELRESIESYGIKDDMESQGKAILSEAEHFLKENKVANVKTIMEWGHTAEEILRIAKEENTDLILVGSRGKRRGILHGSSSKEVVERAESSVMVAR
jgi:nucleotide-binding universal stress UspA family protein